MNAAPLLYIDPFDLAGSLRTRGGLFAEGRLEVRGPNPDHPEALGWYRRAGVQSGKWPELTAVLDRIKQLGDPAQHEFGRIFLLRLDPGATLPWSPATPERRLLMALRTNTAMATIIGGTALQLLPGNLTLVDHTVPWTLYNGGEWPAVHLVVEFRPSGVDNTAGVAVGLEPADVAP